MPPTTAHHEPLDPRIARFVRHACDEMSVAQVGEILGLSRRAVIDAIQARRLACAADKNSGAAHTRSKYTLGKAAVIIYIVRTTTCDKPFVLDAIRESCPRWLTVAEKAAAGGYDSTAVPTQSTPVIYHRTKRRLSTGHDPFASHPDFFRETTTP